MASLTILRGVSGSGKSTWAKSMALRGSVVVSRDALREQLFGSAGQDYYELDNLAEREELITKAEHFIIRSALSDGYNVISDNTNLVPKFVKSLATIANDVGADVEILPFSVSLELAMDNQRLRQESGGRFVPENVVKRQLNIMHRTPSIELPEPLHIEPYVPQPNSRRAYIFDIDGTLAHMAGRSPYDMTRVGEDSPDMAVVDVLGQIIPTRDVILLSGRSEDARIATEEWLDEHRIVYDELFMRASGDNRPDEIIKLELFNAHIRNHFDVMGVFDDRPKVCRMWRKLGIKVFQVGDPHVEF